MNPYETYPSRQFWRSAVAQADLDHMADLWRPKVAGLAELPTVTAGSCFAQNIARNLVARGLEWLDCEPVPEGMDPESAAERGYGVFSFRTGNIYTVALLNQWLEWALAGQEPPREIWMEEGAYFDPFRPGLDGAGFNSPEAVHAAREITLQAIRDAVEKAGLFVFTMGLTEAWLNDAGGYVYPVCPGTVRGRFDPDRHRMHNYGCGEMLELMHRSLELMRSVNPDIRILLTVSPQPLTATATDDHALSANTYTKSALRAVAGELAQAHDYVDYFPSYELVTAYPFKGRAFGDNLRTVTKDGIAEVMALFFDGLACGPETLSASSGLAAAKPGGDQPPEDDVICDDAILEYYQSL
ncbi:GSCFA domain-containing protein [Aestuariispira insulae]|uniref:GSCFA family protein n=1 Tax=Aestuariispira insulae TaxID=1461337 RepID=A0A3D9H8K5_9PROT|nr:GSCFA domain-containing protein [Aestuariispira insulae]RED45830.1 GSCFA family protein [Aestuariispira insulae]